jgi:hypothetical protein
MNGRHSYAVGMPPYAVEKGSEPCGNGKKPCGNGEKVCGNGYKVCGNGKKMCGKGLKPCGNESINRFFLFQSLTCPFLLVQFSLRRLRNTIQRCLLGVKSWAITF